MTECRRCGCQHLEPSYSRECKTHILLVRTCRNCGTENRQRISTKSKPQKPLARIDDAFDVVDEL